METEFKDIDQKKAWNKVYQEIRNESNNFSYIIKDAKKIENKNLNRYRDVNPFDHSRVRLQRNELDYINASLVNVDSAGRSYILTQGPLPLTTGHFWLMIWEQNSTGILMLNRIIEKNTVKCHQYWPVGKKNGGDDSIVAHDVNLKITIIGEKIYPDYTTRAFCLTDLESSESRIILQFHYTTWPDFGVPESPAAFLDFLFAVRASGILNNNVGPSIVHCSAGIGRSGTFCLVDSCLVLIEKSKDLNCINVRQQLLEMRQYRMGLIQTPDQLRFSYLAILEGAQRLLSQGNLLRNGSISNECLYKDSNYCNTEKQEDIFSHDLIPLTLRSDSSQSSDSVESISSSYTGSINKNEANSNESVLSKRKNEMIEHIMDNLKENVKNNENIQKENIVGEILSSNSDTYKADSLCEVRKRARKEREERTALIVQNIKNKQRESERWQKRRSFLNISMGIVFIIGLGYFAYKIYSKS